MGNIKSPQLVIITFLWIGFVCAISFMEAWLKFRAPGITLPLGLGIGRLVFNALNKVEWVFAIAGTFSFIKYKYYSNQVNLPLFAFVVLILISQTIWLLPALDQRAQLIIDGAILAPSSYHIYYVATEVLKVISLSVFGFRLFQTKPVKRMFN